MVSTFYKSILLSKLHKIICLIINNLFRCILFLLQISSTRRSVKMTYWSLRCAALKYCKIYCSSSLDVNWHINQIICSAAQISIWELFFCWNFLIVKDSTACLIMCHYKRHNQQHRSFMSILLLSPCMHIGAKQSLKLFISVPFQMKNSANSGTWISIHLICIFRNASCHFKNNSILQLSFFSILN